MHKAIRDLETARSQGDLRVGKLNSRDNCDWKIHAFLPAKTGGCASR